MINSKEKFNECIIYEKAKYFKGSKKILIKRLFADDEDYVLWSFVKCLRKSEYHFNAGHQIRFAYYKRKKNRIGKGLGISINHNSIDKGLRIWHYGSIIINPHAQIGLDCQLHGNNCIGNKGEFDIGLPIIGNNVDVGYGAVIVGGITIADNIKIGANSVVTKSFSEPGITIAGIPAKKI